MNRTLGRWALASRWRTFASTPAYESERGVESYYRTDTHWGPKGNELVGRVIASHAGASWLGRPVATPIDGCDVLAYCARFAKLADADVRAFARRIVHGAAGAASPR